MKFIKEVPNEFVKTELYGFNNKLILKFEAGNYEQIYKISELDLSDDIEEVLDESFYLKVVERFKQMSNDFEDMIDSADY